MIRMMLDDLYPSMPWDEIDNVVFDVGNVLLAFGEKQILEEYLPEVPELHAELGVRMFRSPYWCMLDRGSATPEEAVDAMSRGAEHLRPYIAHIMRSWVAMEHVIGEGVDAVKACHAHGKRLFVLSNYCDSAFRVVDEKYDFFDLFEAKVISSRLGLVKPEAAIYAHVTDTFGLDPKRTLFVDDNIANIEGALHAGWQAVCYNRPGKLTAFFGA